MYINNLNSFDEHQKYYDFYTENNNQLNDIIQNITQKYSFSYNPKKYYRLNDKNMGTRNIYELSGIIIMLNAIIEKTFYGFCIKTGKKYKCEKMHCCNNNLSKFGYTTYHFNCSEDEFVILFGWEYFSPILIHYPKDSIIFNISYRYSDIRQVISNSNINYSISYYPKDNFISYSIGLMPNPGHHFWQEVFGLMLLIEYNLIDNIDEFIIYKYDYLNIADVLQNKFNKKITHMNTDTQNYGLTVNLSKHFISNSLIDTFKNIYELKDNRQKNEINILFDIRTNDRRWLNQIPIIVNIINSVKNTYQTYTVNFFISGFYCYEKSQANSIYNSNKEVREQLHIFNTIQKCISFPIYNLINSKLSKIIRICQKIDLCIANTGSGLSFFYQTIFNNDTICLTLKKNVRDFDKQRYAFENCISNCVFIEPKYITDFNGNFIVKQGCLLPLVISKLNNTIQGKQK
jgi:hypothetical protein